MNFETSLAGRRVGYCDVLRTVVRDTRRHGRKGCTPIGRYKDVDCGDVNRPRVGACHIPAHGFDAPARPTDRRVSGGNLKWATCIDHRDEHVIGIERRPTSAVVANHHPEVHIAIGGRKGFADGGCSGEQVGIAGKDPLRTSGGIPGTEQRACAVITIVDTLLCAQIALLPAVRQRVA